MCPYSTSARCSPPAGACSRYWRQSRAAGLYTGWAAIFIGAHGSYEYFNTCSLTSGGGVTGELEHFTGRLSEYGSGGGVGELSDTTWRGGGCQIQDGGGLLDTTWGAVRYKMEGGC